jgi:hypothetical protein
MLTRAEIDLIVERNRQWLDLPQAEDLAPAALPATAVGATDWIELTLGKVLLGALLAAMAIGAAAYAATHADVASTIAQAACVHL